MASQFMKSIMSIDHKVQELNRQLGRIQFLSGSSVKIIAILIMFMDHFSKIVLAWLINDIIYPLFERGVLARETFNTADYFVRFTLQGVGSIAFPLFCILLAEGFYYTKNKKRYIGIMLLFAIISEIPFDIGFFSYYSRLEETFPFYIKYQNVFFTLFLGLLALCGIEKFSCYNQKKVQKVKSIVLQIFSVGAMAGLATLLNTDYGSQGVLFIAGFYICRKNRIYQTLVFLVLYILTTGNQPTIYVIISGLIIMLYNGTRGKLRFKYFFYAFYPIHIILLYLVSLFLGKFFIII